MGCWNETCLVSNLPIRWNDPVVAFFISYDRYGDETDFSGSCYTTDKAFAISLPIKATYDDYGSIEKYNDDDVSHVKNMLGMEMSDILDLLHDEKLSMKSIYRDKMAPVGLIMIHEDIYKTIIEKIANVEDKIISEIKKEFLSSIDKEEEKHGKLYISDSNRYCSICMNKDSNFLKFLVKFACQDKKRVDKIIEGLIERVKVDLALRRLRKTWLPHSGKGSQENGIKPYLILAEAVKQ